MYQKLPFVVLFARRVNTVIQLVGVEVQIFGP